MAGDPRRPGEHQPGGPVTRPPHPPRRLPLALVALALLAVAGAATVLVGTRPGPYVSPDAVSYIGTARSLAAGDGFTAPPGTPEVGHFPPLFPSLLAGLDVLGLDPLHGARWLNAAVLGLTVLLVGLALRGATGLWWPGVVGGVLVVTATDVLAYSSSALSEPLFVLLTVTTLVLLAHYVDRRRPWLLAAAIAAASLAFLTRYVGIALVVAGAVALIVFRGGRRWRGVPQALAYSAGATVPVVVWLAWARSSHDRGSEGDIAFHPFDAEYLETGGRNLVDWFVPSFVPSVLGAALVVAAIGLVVWASRASGAAGEPRSRRDRLPVIAAILAASYVALLLFDRLFLDASALLDRRFLLPLHVVAIIGVLALVRNAAARDPLRVVVLATVAALVAVQLGEAAAWVYRSVDDGTNGRGGYTAESWEQSSVIAAIRELPSDVPVYTNGADAIWFLTGRKTQTLPQKYDQLTDRANERYEEEMSTMAERLSAEGGVIALFNEIRSRPFLPSADDLEGRIPLHELSSDEVGALYIAR